MTLSENCNTSPGLPYPFVVADTRGSAVRLASSLSEEFTIENGVKQGCSIASDLFNCVIYHLIASIPSHIRTGSLITNHDGSSSRDITSRIAKAASAMYRLSNPLFRKHRISIQTKINMYRALVVSVLLYGSKHGPPPSPIAGARTCSTCAVKGASYVCSGSSTSATIASVNARSNQLHHLSYDNAACAGFDISTACHPPSLFEEPMTSTQTSMAGRDLAQN